VVVKEWHWKISWDADKRCPHCGPQSVELVEHRFFSCPFAQQRWRYAANIMWQLLAERGNLGPRKSFSMMQCFFHQPLCKALNDSTPFGFSWGVVFHGSSSAKGMIRSLILCNVKLRKHVQSFGTPCKIMVGLSGNKLFQI
jgi:hypothetical protein